MPKIKAKQEVLEVKQILTPSDALSYVRTISKAKFDQTLEICCVLGIDTKHSDQNVRGVVQLPSGTGKKLRVAVICTEAKAKEALDAGADLVGSSELIDIIKSGKVDFDVCIATPDVMHLLQQVAKILGPKKLMPNPKLGTVTFNVASAVKEAKFGKVEYRADKGGIVHAGIGKLSFSDDDLLKNLNAFLAAVKQARPSVVKESNYMKRCYLSSTMSSGSVKLNLS